MLLKTLLFFISLFYLGCASQLVVLKPACTELNWFERGRQDGMQGQPSNNWTMKAKECEKMAQSEIQNYMDGWNHGLSMYCTQEHGFATAKSGLPYRKTCPDKYEVEFMKGFEQGLKVFMIEKETASIISQIESMQEDLLKEEVSPQDKEALRSNIAMLTEKKMANIKTLEKYNTSLR